MINKTKKPLLRRTFFTTRSLKRSALGVWMLCSILSLASCDKSETASSNASAFAIDKKYERGPVTLHLKVAREHITTAEDLTLKLEALADAGYEVEFPAPGEKLEDFKIVDHEEPLPALTREGKVLHSQSYQLEPFLAGEYKIPLLKIAFWKKTEKEPQKHDIETETLTIRVSSILTDSSAQPKIKDLVPPMLIPGWDRKWFWFTAAGVAILAACSAGGLLYRRYRRDEMISPVVSLPAHELALQQLDTLLADRLIEDGYTKEFYIRLSDILRHYIENRFSLCAPERTTEEFLLELRQSGVLADSHKRLLKEFLVRCDLVKFAKFLPAADETHQAVAVTREFIDETKLIEKEETAPL